MEAKDSLHDPLAPNHGRGCGAVRRHFQDAGLSHQAAADRILRQLDSAHSYTGNAGNAVVPRESFVQERPIGMGHRSRGDVCTKELLNEQAGFFDSGELQRIVKLVVVIKSRGWRAVVNLSKIEPVVRECVNEPAGS